MKARLITRLAIVIAALMLCGCKDRILELDYVHHLTIKEINGVPDTIRITGLVGHSALGISGITTAEHGDALEILVHLALATPEQSGNLNYTLTIPKSAQKVTFGADNVMIWDRSAGILLGK